MVEVRHKTICVKYLVPGLTQIVTKMNNNGNNASTALLRYWVLLYVVYICQLIELLQ